VVTAFRACLHDRLVATDPTATPASCRLRPVPAGSAAGQGGGAAALSPAVKHAIAGVGKKAAGIDFAATLERTLFFQVGVFVISFLLMLALPRMRREASAAQQAAAQAVAPAAGDLAAGDLVAKPVLIRVTDHD
jgi:hypothetical protein